MFSACRAKCYERRKRHDNQRKVTSLLLFDGQLTGTRQVEAIDPRGRAGFITLQLLDLLPEPAAIWNIWENKLALVESEGIGSVVATER
jgi:hypothetical protein